MRHVGSLLSEELSGLVVGGGGRIQVLNSGSLSDCSLSGNAGSLAQVRIKLDEAMPRLRLQYEGEGMSFLNAGRFDTCS